MQLLKFSYSRLYSFILECSDSFLQARESVIQRLYLPALHILLAAG